MDSKTSLEKLILIRFHGNRLKYLMIFNRGIDTVKITALSNHKPGILKQLYQNDYSYIAWCIYQFLSF
jgi:hypothetical protein